MEELRRGNVAPVIATSDIDEFSYAVSSNFVPLRLSSDRASRFRGELKGRQLGGIEIFDTRANQHFVERNQTLAAQTPCGKYMLHLQLSGVGVFRQDGREATLQRGDLAFYDSDRGYSLSLDDHFRNVIIVIPKDLMRLPVDATNQLTATRFSGQHEVLTLVKPFIHQLVRRIEHVPSHSEFRLARSTVDLLSTVIHAELGIDQRYGALSGHHNAQFERVLAFIDDHLSDPYLDPQQIADANFISLRTLHELFRKERQSVARWVRERRLELCKTDLADPLQRDLQISSIATRYGFVNSAHFSRLFKRSFGESPTEFRMKCQSQINARNPISHTM